MTKADPISGNYDIWIDDLKQKRSCVSRFRGASIIIPFGHPMGKASSTQAIPPVGQAFFANLQRERSVQQLLKIMKGTNMPTIFPADGKLLLFVKIGDIDRGDIWILPLDKSAAPFPYLKTPAGEIHPQFSPGAQAGKWIAYTSDESGIDQVYVRRFTGGACARGKMADLFRRRPVSPLARHGQRHRLSRARREIDVCSHSLYKRLGRGWNSPAIVRRGVCRRCRSRDTPMI